jgi:hypothetical protein
MLVSEILVLSGNLQLNQYRLATFDPKVLVLNAPLIAIFHVSLTV